MARKQLYPPSVDPGFPELPACPKGWSETTFDEVFEVQTRPIKLKPDGRYKLVVARRNRGGIELRSEVQGCEVLTKTQFETHEGDFLISRRQIIHGACGVVPAHLHGAVVSGEYSALRTKAGYVMDYFRHFSHSPYFQRTCFHSSHGVDVEKMIFKLDEWLTRRVQVPPIGEQRKIAAILSSVDEAIEETQAVIDQVQVVKKGLMQELLTRGLPGRHKKFKQTEIGEIPASWEVNRIGDVSRVYSGATPSRARPEFFETQGGFPWVKTMDLNDGRILQTSENISRLALELTSCRLHPPGTVLIAMYGGFAQIGRSGILAIEAATNQAISAICLDLSLYEPMFVNAWLVSARPQWRTIAASSRKDPNITRNDVLSFNLPRPSMSEQCEIVGIIDAVAQRLDTEVQSIHELRRLKQALMSLLLTGELRVTP